MKIYDLVRWCFDEPEMEDEVADILLYSCTGYPCFWKGPDPRKCLVQQLRHAKRSLARGFTIDDVWEGKDYVKTN